MTKKEQIIVKHDCSKQTEIALIQQLQSHQASKIDDIHRVIMGNGKPGLKTEMDQIKGALKLTQISFGVVAVIISIVLLFI